MSHTTLGGLWAHATNSQKLLDTALNSKDNFGLTYELHKTKFDI